MSHLKLFILLGFAIMFVAGLTIGRSYPLVKPTAVTGPTTRPDEADGPHFPTLDKELDLSATQKQQMERIWKDAHAKTDALSHQFHEFDRERDDAIQAMLDPDQKPEYIEIQHQRDEHVNTLRGEISKTMKDAEKATRELLTPDQQKKFDEIVKHGPRHGPPPMMMGGGDRRFHRHGGPDTGPTDGPDTVPSR